MANNNNPETFHEVPASKYWYLGDTVGAVPKAFFQIWTPAIFFAGVILTLLTEHTAFWFILASAVWNVALVRGWYITLPAIGVLAVYLYVRSKRQTKRRKQQSEAAERRRKLDQLLGGE